LLLRGRPPASAIVTFQAETLTLVSSSRTPFEVDGELIGELSATISLKRSGLRVVVP
jgi:diacylglycerol kinase family enzyme